MQILSDSDFEKQYSSVIVPFCNEHENSSYYESFDAKKIHLLSYINENAKANVIILHGFTECAKKFDETAYYLFSEGYSVYAPDLRGHGLSFKDDAPEYAVNSKDFDCYAKDVACLVENIKNGSSLPIYCYTHSLGGTAVLLSMIDNDLPVEKLVLSSPMICGNMGMPVGIARAVSVFLNAIGKGDMPAPGKCVFKPDEDNVDATSIERGRHALKFKADNKEYQTCGPTMAWVRHSILACDKLIDRKNADKFNSKMLVILPEKDRQLLSSYQQLFIDNCLKANKDIMVSVLPGTCHEIYQSKSKELEAYMQMITAFFNG